MPARLGATVQNILMNNGIGTSRNAVLPHIRTDSNFLTVKAESSRLTGIRSRQFRRRSDGPSILRLYR